MVQRATISPILTTKVPGTGGESGRVTEKDVRDYLERSGYAAKKITPTAFNLAKKEALEAAGVRVGKTPSETAALAREILAGL